jgi:hypothetical protein
MRRMVEVHEGRKESREKNYFPTILLVYISINISML